MPMNVARLAVEAHFLVVVLRTEDDVGNLAEPDDDAVLFLDDELTEFLGRPQIGVGDEVDRHHRSLGLAERGEIVVSRQRVAHGRRGNPERRHRVRLQPDAHRERPVAENVGTLHAADGAQLRLHDARQVVGNLVLIEIGRREAEIHRRELGVRGLHLDDRRFRLRRQLIAHLRDLGLDLRQRRIGVVVQRQVHGDRADPLRAGRLHVVDAVGAGNDPLERRRDEPAYEIGVRPDVDRRHPDDRDVAARILPHAQRADRLQPGDENDQVDDNRQDRPLYEEVCEPHCAFP